MQKLYDVKKNLDHLPKLDMEETYASAVGFEIVGTHPWHTL